MSGLAQYLPSEWVAARPEAGWHRNPRLQVALRDCRAITRRHAKSFYFSSFPLPEDKKQAAFAVYAFCRYIDDCIDEVPEDSPVPAPTRQKLIDELAAIERGESALAFAPAFAEVNRQYAIPAAFYHDLIEGCCSDRGAVDIASFAELELYCYRVASVVGLMMSKIFGLREAEGALRAAEMGLAMQLTNILRDVREDALRQRFYLPRDEREAAQISEAQLLSGTVDPAWQAFCREQIARARDYYRRGEQGLLLLEDDGSRRTATLMARIYGGILDAIERADCDVFSRRCYVSFWRKLGLTYSVFR